MVRKTVVAALVAGVFTAIYALVVAGIGTLIGRKAAARSPSRPPRVAAVALQPVRVRAGLLADRLVYGNRATPYEVLTEFSGQVAGTVLSRTCCPGWRGC